MKVKTCSKCKKTKDINQYIEQAKHVHGDKYDYSLVEYKQAHSKVSIICPEHGVFEQNAVSHLQGHGCAKCAGNIVSYGQRISKDCFVNKSEQIHGNKYDYSLIEDVSSKKKVEIICPTHGVFEQVAECHYSGSGCPKCSNNISYKEQELQEWISQYIDTKTNDRTLIGPYELDIVIPSKNIAIEYNGLYWHSEQRGKDGKYHLNKYNLCKEQGYRLIQIWENEWLLKKDIVKSILLSAIGIYETKIGARQCEVSDVLPKEVRTFYDNNHVQGFKGGKHKGLYYNNELVSLMTIDSRNELQRFSNKINTQVYGAFSKLLKSFNMTDKVYTFADLRYFTGDVYKKNGFEYNDTIKSNYYYFKNRSLSVIHRRRYQKQYLNKMNDFDYNPDLTEYQNMLNNGYDRIWDCGKIKYIKGE